jgi:carbon-monoxide dehydrogenase large subunit
VAQAADNVIEQLRERASEQLEVPTSDLEYADGVFSVVGARSRRAAVSELGAAEATVHFDDEREPHGYGCHVAAVKIDRETGRVSIERYVAVDDAGVLINPLLADGQMHGGLAQGLGQALAEQMTFGSDGTVLSSSLIDYSLPRASDVPAFLLDHTVHPTPLNPIGAKGIGESGAVGAPAAMLGAILDALGDSDSVVELPLTTERVWRRIREEA